MICYMIKVKPFKSELQIAISTSDDFTIIFGIILLYCLSTANGDFSKVNTFSYMIIGVVCISLIKNMIIEQQLPKPTPDLESGATRSLMWGEWDALDYVKNKMKRIMFYYLQIVLLNLMLNKENLSKLIDEIKIIPFKKSLNVTFENKTEPKPRPIQSNLPPMNSIIQIINLDKQGIQKIRRK